LSAAPPSRPPPKPWLRPELVASWREIVGFLFVLLIPFVVMSAFAASHGSKKRYMQIFLSDHSLLLNGAAEAGLLGLALVFLHLRGWTPADLRIRPTLISSLQGLGLAPVTLVANSLVVFTCFGLLFLAQSQYHDFAGFLLSHNPQLQNLHVEHLSWTVLISSMVLNAFLEEIICTAYAFTQFASKLGALPAILLTVVLRAACHTYQGGVHAFGIGAVFLIFTLWYWRTRNLWTLIFAHAVIDLASLSAIKLLVHH
jgi:membrane protease YdiL (CAAX protease family)